MSDGALRDELLERVDRLMRGTFEKTGEQADIEHEDGVFTYPDGKRLSRDEHIAITDTSSQVLEHDIVHFEVQRLSDTVARVYLDHTLRTMFTEFPFDDPGLREQMENGIMYATHFTFIKSERGWQVISMDGHVVPNGYVPRDQRTQPNVITYPASSA